MEKDFGLPLESIGQDKAIQNPQTAIDRKFGTYNDPVKPGAVTPANITPGPDPKPFGSMK